MLSLSPGSDREEARPGEQDPGPTAHPFPHPHSSSDPGFSVHRSPTFQAGKEPGGLPNPQ